MLMIIDFKLFILLINFQLILLRKKIFKNLNFFKNKLKGENKLKKIDYSIINYYILKIMIFKKIQQILKKINNNI